MFLTKVIRSKTMAIIENIDTSMAVSEFLWDEDAPEILLNNLSFFNERTWF